MLRACFQHEIWQREERRKKNTPRFSLNARCALCTDCRTPPQEMTHPCDTHPPPHTHPPFLSSGSCFDSLFSLRALPSILASTSLLYERHRFQPDISARTRDRCFHKKRNVVLPLLPEWPGPAWLGSGVGRLTRGLAISGGVFCVFFPPPLMIDVTEANAG